MVCPRRNKKGENMSKKEERKSWWPNPESISARPFFCWQLLGVGKVHVGECAEIVECESELRKAK
jgi:hypothetical protein